MSVSGPELHDRKPIELTPPVALTHLVPCWIWKRDNQFPTFSGVVEKVDNTWIKTSIILALGHLIARPADDVRPTVRSEEPRQCRSVFI